jgi:parvulin-like peptidyl-prolyl isomerase
LAKKNKKIERPRRKPTKRQLSRWQKQKRRQRIIIGVGAAVILMTLGLVIAGINDCYVTENKPLREQAIEVNGVVFDMGYYIDVLSYQTGEYSYLVEYFADAVIQSIQHNELVKQEAMELGFTISDEEVKEYIEANDLPNNQVVRDIIKTQLLIEKMRDEYFNVQIPISADQRYVMAMFLESRSQVEEIKQRLLDGEDFGDIAAEFSLEAYTKQESGDLGWRPAGIMDGLLNTSVLENFVLGYPLDTLSLPIEDAEKTKNLGYWLAMVLEKNEETGEAHVQAMLLSSQEEALIIKSRLEQGEEFSQLAEEFSQMWSDENGADLGWIVEGDISPALDEYVFNAETAINTVSQPIQDEAKMTSGGYWLFKVLESDYREVSDEDRERLVSQMLEEWLLEIWENPENIIVSYINETKRQFAINKVLEQ